MTRDARRPNGRPSTLPGVLAAAKARGTASGHGASDGPAVPSVGVVSHATPIVFGRGEPLQGRSESDENSICWFDYHGRSAQDEPSARHHQLAQWYRRLRSLTTDFPEQAERRLGLHVRAWRPASGTSPVPPGEARRSPGDDFPEPQGDSFCKGGSVCPGQRPERSQGTTVRCHGSALTSPAAGLRPADHPPCS